jgi:cytidylate kinase
MKRLKITIEGPMKSGKSTVASVIAEALDAAGAHFADAHDPDLKAWRMLAQHAPEILSEVQYEVYVVQTKEQG